MILLALATGPQGGRAADPVAYAVQITPTGEAGLDGAVHDASVLLSLRETAPVGGFALVARARADADRFVAALRSFGYYKGTVAIRIDGSSLQDPDLADRLEALPASSVAQVDVTLTTGPLFHLGRVELTGDVPADLRGKLGLEPGMPARAADVLAAGARLQQALRDAGYALAVVEQPQATLRTADDALDVSFAVSTGPRVDLGDITITGLDHLNEAYVRRRLLLHQGERYDPARIEAARQDLMATGVLSSVRIDTATALDAQGELPVRIDVTERPRRAIDLAASWSTDRGFGASASWTHRNLFGNAESLVLSATATGLGGAAVLQPAYDVSARLTLPDWRRRDQSLTFLAMAVKEYLQAYDRTAVVGGVTLRRQLTPELAASIGISAEEAHIVQQGDGRDYSLLQGPVGLTWDSTREQYAPATGFDPVHGVRAALTVTPTANLAGTGGSGFVITEAAASTYLDIGKFLLDAPSGRTVLALRGLVGWTGGVSVLDIPPDQRFYAGGSATIRGYRFQSVGPKFADGNPIGGTAIEVGTVELRQRFGANWGAALFVDAGQVSDRGTPFTGDVAVGAGVGVRYYTILGPIRFDAAVPLVRQGKTPTGQIYIGIGQAF